MRWLARINRIRLEFKASRIVWNLYSDGIVLIESDWNLKEYRNESELFGFFVLIESDWNLKSYPLISSNMHGGY